MQAQHPSSSATSPPLHISIPSLGLSCTDAQLTAIERKPSASDTAQPAFLAHLLLGKSTPITALLDNLVIAPAATAAADNPPADKRAPNTMLATHTPGTQQQSAGSQAKRSEASASRQRQPEPASNSVLQPATPDTTPRKRLSAPHSGTAAPAAKRVQCNISSAGAKSVQAKLSAAAQAGHAAAKPAPIAVSTPVKTTLTPCLPTGGRQHAPSPPLSIAGMLAAGHTAVAQARQRTAGKAASNAPTASPRPSSTQGDPGPPVEPPAGASFVTKSQVANVSHAAAANTADGNDTPAGATAAALQGARAGMSDADCFDWLKKAFTSSLPRHKLVTSVRLDFLKECSADARLGADFRAAALEATSLSVSTSAAKAAKARASELHRNSVAVASAQPPVPARTLESRSCNVAGAAAAGAGKQDMGGSAAVASGLKGSSQDDTKQCTLCSQAGKSMFGARCKTCVAVYHCLQVCMRRTGVPSSGVLAARIMKAKGAAFWRAQAWQARWQARERAVAAGALPPRHAATLECFQLIEPGLPADLAVHVRNATSSLQEKLQKQSAGGEAAAAAAAEAAAGPAAARAAPAAAAACEDAREEGHCGVIMLE